MNTVSVVVAERGADWVHWARELRSSASSVVVMVQDRDEKLSAFGERVAGRLERFEREQNTVERVAFVGGERWDGRNRMSSTHLLRSLSSQLTQSGRSVQLHLDASQAQPRGRRMMQALAWAIGDLAKGTGLSISVGAPGAGLATA